MLVTLKTELCIENTLLPSPGGIRRTALTLAPGFRQLPWSRSAAAAPSSSEGLVFPPSPAVVWGWQYDQTPEYSADPGGRFSRR